MSVQNAPLEVIGDLVSASGWRGSSTDDSLLDVEEQPGDEEAASEHAPLPMAGLRICHLGKYYPPAPGGIETHVQTLARAQAALGADVSVVCVDHARRSFDRPIATDLASAEANTFDIESIAKSSGQFNEPSRLNIDSPPRDHRHGELPVDYARHPYRVVAEDGHSWSEPDGAVRVIRAIARRSIHRLELCPGLRALLRSLEDNGTHLLHLHTPNPTMLLAVARAKPKIPLVITHHSDIVRQRVLKWAMRPLERIVYRKATRIQVTSLVYRKTSRFLRRYDRRVEVLPLGLDLSTFTNPSDDALSHAESLRRQNGVPLWLSVGRLVYYKGYHVAIKALRHVPGTLMIVGNGPLDGELKALAREQGVADRIAWRGYLSRDELAGAYLASAALWFPSNARSEAFGLVQVEAMASGCPVINTDIPGSGVAWVSRHEESGLTVGVNDPAALAAAARRLLSEEGLRDRLSRGAKRRAITEFDHLTMAQRSLQIYRKAMADAAPMNLSEGGMLRAPVENPAGDHDPSRTAHNSPHTASFNETRASSPPILVMGPSRGSRTRSVSASPGSLKSVPCESLAK